MGDIKKGHKKNTRTKGLINNWGESVMKCLDYALFSPKQGENINIKIFINLLLIL